MPSGLDTERLNAVFQSRPDIIQGISQAAGTTPREIHPRFCQQQLIFGSSTDTKVRIALFNDITSFVYDQLSGAEPASKRRRVDNGTANGFTPSNAGSQAPKSTNGPVTSSVMDEKAQLEIKDISVSVPQRKKFDLCFSDTHLFARAPGATTPAPGIAYAWTDIGMDEQAKA